MTTNVPPVKNKGGRPIGSMGRLAKEAREKAAATGVLPHEFLLMIVRGEPIFRIEIEPSTGKKIHVLEQYDFEARRDAAKAAAPYYAPKISTVEVINGVSDNELDSIIARAAAEAGISLGPSGESKTHESQECAGDSKPRARRIILDE